MESQRDFPSSRILVPFHLSNTQVEWVSEREGASGSPYHQAKRYEPSGKEWIFVHSFLGEMGPARLALFRGEGNLGGGI